MQIFKKQIDKKIGIIVVLVIFLIALSFIILNNKNLKDQPLFPDFKIHSKIISSKIEKIKKFSSEEEFKTYLQASANETGNYYNVGGGIRNMKMMKESVMPMAMEEKNQK